MKMTEHAKELRRHADKVGSLSGDVTAAMHAAAAHIEALERELRAAEIRLHDVATLCANVESELAEIKRRTYVAVTCNHVGRMERAEARVAELEAERAEQKAGKVMAYLSNDKTKFFVPSMEGKDVKHALYMAHWMAGWTPLYAAPPVTAPVRLTDDQADKVDEAIREALGDAYDCLRVWNAWSYGTMGPDDFSQVAEDSDRVAEIRNAAAVALGFKVDE